MRTLALAMAALCLIATAEARLKMDLPVHLEDEKEMAEWYAANLGDIADWRKKASRKQKVWLTKASHAWLSIRQRQRAAEKAAREKVAREKAALKARLTRTPLTVADMVDMAKNPARKIDIKPDNLVSPLDLLQAEGMLADSAGFMLKELIATDAEKKIQYFILHTPDGHQYRCIGAPARLSCFEGR